MKEYSWEKRAGFYSEAFPKWPPLRTDDRWIDGVWVLGNNYRNKSSFYGSFPPGFLNRVMALFPDADNVLHLFSGSLEPGNYTRFDLVEDDIRKPDVCGDAHELGNHFEKGEFDLILSDPPYHAEAAIKYGTPMIKRYPVVKECAKVLSKGGYLVWLDMMVPMFSKKELHLCGLIGVVRSTNHIVRMVSIFKKV